MSSSVAKSKCDLPKRFQRCNRTRSSKRVHSSCTAKGNGACTAGVQGTCTITGLEPLIANYAGLLGLGGSSLIGLGGSSLLSALLRAACFVDLAASRKDQETQTNLDPPSGGPAAEGRKRKRRRRRDSRDRKRKKKEKRRKKDYCSSPTYSDYEPDNPLLRFKNK